MLVSTDPCLDLYEEIYRLADKIYTVYYSPIGVEIASPRGIRMSIICSRDRGGDLRLIVRLYGTRYSEAGIYEDLYGEAELRGLGANRFLEALESLLRAGRISTTIRERYLGERVVSNGHRS